MHTQPGMSNRTKYSKKFYVHLLMPFRRTYVLRMLNPSLKHFAKSFVLWRDHENDNNNTNVNTSGKESAFEKKLVEAGDEIWKRDLTRKGLCPDRDRMIHLVKEPLVRPMTWAIGTRLYANSFFNNTKPTRNYLLPTKRGWLYFNKGWKNIRRKESRCAKNVKWLYSWWPVLCRRCQKQSRCSSGASPSPLFCRVPSLRGPEKQRHAATRTFSKFPINFIYSLVMHSPNVGAEMLKWICI